MEITWKKILLVCAICIGIVVLPIFLVSNMMMDFYQKQIDKNPNSGFSKWLQLNTGHMCYRTGRPERAARCYYNFLDRYRDDVRRPDILLRYGYALEDANRNAEAIQVYEQICKEYPEHEVKKDAEMGLNRIRYIKPR